MQPLKAGAQFDATTAYGGALPAYADTPQFTSMSQADQVIDLVKNIRQKDASFAKKPTGQQIEFVQNTVLPALKTIPKLDALGDFGQGIIKPLAVTDYAPPVHPNSLPYQAGNAITQLLGGGASTTAGAAIGAISGAPAGGIGALPGGIIGGALGAGTFAAAQRPANIMRARNASFKPRNKALEVEKAVKGAGIDYATALVGQFLPGGNSLGGKVLKGALSGAALSAGAGAADQYADEGKVTSDTVFQNALHGALLGGVVPAGIHLAPKAVKAGLRYQNERAAKTVVRGGRRAQKGFIGKDPLDDLFPNGKPDPIDILGDYKTDKTKKRQYAGEITDEDVSVTATKRMQDDADNLVDKAVKSGKPENIERAIELHIFKGERAKAEALTQALGNNQELAPELQAKYLRKAVESASEAGLNLNQLKHNPAMKARAELVRIVTEERGSLKHGDGLTGDDLTKATEEAGKIIQELFHDIFKLAASVFRTTVKKSGKVLPQKVFRESPPKSRAKRNKDVWNPKPTLRRAGKFSTKKILPHGESPGQLDLFGNTEDPRRPGLKMENQVIDEAADALKARAERKEARRLERKRQLEAATYKGMKPKQLKLGIRETLPGKNKAEFKTHELLARAFAEDVNAERKPAKDPTADMSPEEKATYLFAKARLRDRKWLAKQLKMKRYNEPKEPLTLEQRKLTSTERALYLSKPKELKLTLKKVSEKPVSPKVRKQRVEQAKLTRQMRRDMETIDQQVQRQRKEAMAEISRLEASLNKQQTLPLSVQKMLNKELEAAITTLSPEMQRYYHDLYARQVRRKLFEALERRTAAPKARPGVPETLEELYNRLEPMMTDEERAHYAARVSNTQRRRFLQKIKAKEPKPKVVKTVLDRFVELHKYDALDPETIPYALKDAAASHVMESKDFKELNGLLDTLGDPTLSRNEILLAEAQLRKFIAERRLYSLWDRVITARYSGLLLQPITQERNYINQIGYTSFRLGVQNSIKAGVDKTIGLVTRQRTKVFRISQEVKDFYEKHDITLKDEFSNIKHDLEHGTNTSRVLQGDVLAPGSKPPNILPGRAGEGFTRASQAIYGTGDRIGYALAYQQAMQNELEIYRRMTGKMPDPTSEVFKALQARATNEAAQTAFTNKGVTSAAVGGAQRGVTHGVDVIARQTGKITDRQSLQAGRIPIPFFNINSNAGTRVFETLPALGAIGITVNRLWQASVTKVPIRKQELAAEIIAAQLIGAIETGMATGNLTTLTYDLGYYGAYVPGSEKQDSRPLGSLKRNVGVFGNRINMTAIFRYAATGKKENLAARDGDTFLPMQGLSPMNEFLLYTTALGAKDRVGHLGYKAGDASRVLEAFAAGLYAVSQKNDSVSGLIRPYNRVMEARNKDTGELDPGVTGTANLIADTIGFKVPLQDAIPNAPVRDPGNVGEIMLNSNPLTANFVPERVSADGTTEQKPPGLLYGKTEFHGAETTEGYLYKLQQDTGNETHLMQALTKKIDVDGQKIPISYRDRQVGQKFLNQRYFGLIETFREAPNFSKLDERQQIQVLSKIKNDLIKAYVAHRFKKPITQPGMVQTDDGMEVDLKLEEAMGAKTLYRGDVNAYRGIINEYIADAMMRAQRDVGTQQVRAAIKNTPAENVLNFGSQ